MAKSKLDKKLKQAMADVFSFSAPKPEGYQELDQQGKDFFNSANLDPDLSYASLPDEEVVAKYKTSYIVIGPARDGIHPAHKFGGKSSQNIRLVAGGGGSGVEEKPTDADRNVIGPNPMKDAATLLLTTKTDHRLKEFGIKTGDVARLGVSAAVMKGDKIAIIAGSEDMHFVTGPNAIDYHKKRNIGVGKIYLNAGNKEINLLEPVPRGDKLIAALDIIFESVDSAIAQVQALNLFVAKMNKVLMNHYHHGFAAEPTLPSFDLQRQCIQFSAEQMRMETSLSSSRGKIQILKSQYLESTGKNYINSRLVMVS